MCTKWLISFLIVIICISEVASVSASPPARIVVGIVTNVASTIFKWLWSFTTSTIKPEKAVSTRSMMRFEAGYTVETVFDGSKAGIEPYMVVVSPAEELLILDSANSNLYKVSTPLSRYSRPKIITGSSEGFRGHVDGKLREGRMYHPKGITVDDSGNIYIADTFNMAIRKITDSGITTIAGGKRSQGGGGGYVDGGSEDVKLSDDFDIVYSRISCSLFVTDRGNQAIYEIQLPDSDCSYEHPVQLEGREEESLHLGVAVIIAAVFCGYMLALLKQRIQSLFSTNKDPRVEQHYKNQAITVPYQRPLKSVRQPLIPPEDEDDCEDEGIIISFGRLIITATSSLAEVLSGLIFSRFRKKRTRHQNLRHLPQLNMHGNHAWNIENDYLIRKEDEPPKLETPRNTYPIMEKPQEKTRKSQTFYDAKDYEEKEHTQKQRKVPLDLKSNQEKSPDKSEIVFGAVQEKDGRREAMVIKAVDYNDPAYSHHHNIRPRVNYMGYSSYSYG